MEWWEFDNWEWWEARVPLRFLVIVVDRRWAIAEELELDTFDLSVGSEGRVLNELFCDVAVVIDEEAINIVGILGEAGPVIGEGGVAITEGWGSKWCVVLEDIDGWGAWLPEFFPIGKGDLLREKREFERERPDFEGDFECPESTPSAVSSVDKESVLSKCVELET
jgi:hypothetical protein